MKQNAGNNTEQSLIAIVDDEACVRESLSSLIRSAGYKVEEFAAAETFLGQGSLDDTACLVLDVRLLGMGGLELQRQLTGMEVERPPIVFISGHANEKEQTLAMMRGAVAFLAKPFSDEALLNAIRVSIARGSAGFDLHPQSSRNKVCPLCRESARIAEIPRRLLHQQGDLHASTVQMIKTLHSQWTEQDGLCWRCWRFYVGLGRVVDGLRTPPTRDAFGLTNSTAGSRQKG
jgi:DNA-binding response OmpR family regulator